MKKQYPSVVTQGTFTIFELLIVIAIISTLAGLILATSGYVQTKGKRARAEAEIAAMIALKQYLADAKILRLPIE